MSIEAKITRPFEFFPFIQTGQYEQMSEDYLYRILSEHLPYDVNTLASNQRYLNRISQALGGRDWSVFRGRRTLDIGCGGGDGYHFRPWLAATLALLGAHSYGLDIMEQDPGFGEYTHIQSDFTAIGLDEMFKSYEGSFDLITCLYVFANDFKSNVLKHSTARQGKRLIDVQYDLQQLAERSLKPGGLLFWDTMKEWQQMLIKHPEFGFVGAQS